MRTYEMEIGGKTYKFRITARNHEELDEMCGGNAMRWLQDVENMMDPLKLWARVAYIGLKGVAENGEIKKSMAYDLYDAMIDDGMDAEEISKHSMKILEESGFFPRGTADGLDEATTTANRGNGKIGKTPKGKA
jgi:hypothetical protein